MKRLVFAVAVTLLLTWPSLAQTGTDDSPATKEDVQRYFQIVKSHDLMKKVMASMAQGIQQMTHEQYVKHQNELSAGYEAKMNAMMEDMFSNMSMDEMMDAMIPAYQKHLTRGDIDNIVAFYSTPTGAKVLREMPAMLAEAMQEMMPIMTKYMDTVQTRLKKETDTMIAEAKKSSSSNSPAAHNRPLNGTCPNRAVSVRKQRVPKVCTIFAAFNIPEISLQ